jgi:hypothetical protein
LIISYFYSNSNIFDFWYYWKNKGIDAPILIANTLRRSSSPWYSKSYFEIS